MSDSPVFRVGDVFQGTRGRLLVNVNESSYGNVEYLDRNSPFDINPEFFELGCHAFRVSRRPNLRIRDNILSGLNNPKLTPLFSNQALPPQDDLNKNLQEIHRILKTASVGSTTNDLNNQFTPLGFMIVGFAGKDSRSIKPELFSTAVDAIVVPIRRQQVIPYDVHANRNIYQNGFAPRSLDTMQVLVKCGFFKLFTPWYSPQGYTTTHNLTRDDDQDEFSRISAALRIPVPSRKINLDYRGEITLSDMGELSGQESKFEGMQFVYNEKGKNLVRDEHNKGTFDFVSPNVDKGKHKLYDVDPWFEWGNVIEDKKEEIFIEQSIEDYLSTIAKNYSAESEITDVGVKKDIYAMFPERMEAPSF